MTKSSLDTQQELIDKLSNSGFKPNRDDYSVLSEVHFIVNRARIGGAETPASASNWVEGPEGFYYLKIYLPKQEDSLTVSEAGAFDFSSLSEIAREEPFSGNCLGVVLMADPTSEKVLLPLNPSSIWALRQFGSIDPDESLADNLGYFLEGTEKQVKNPLSQKPLTIGAPSEALIPMNLRASLSETLKRVLNIEDPKFCVVKGFNNNQLPILLYNIFPENQDQMKMVSEKLSKLHPTAFRCGLLNSNYSMLEDHMNRIVG